jgi:N-hydroxyarylamine O-acetyltransferase
MMMSDFDLSAYLARIRYTGDTAPTEETLRAVHLLHPQAIPFENLDVLLRRPLRLDPASLQHKLVAEGRGGYCFEHNLLFGHALRAMGFDVTWLAGRVLWNMPEGVVNARTHMLLLVRIGGEQCLADVGFGGLTLTAPLRLQADIEQPTPHELFRLRPYGEGLVMEASIGGAWKALYRFDLSEQVQADYDMASWFLCHYPESPFLRGVVAARVDGGRRYVLRNNDLGTHEAGRTDRRPLVTVAELKTVLTGLFAIRLPDAPELDAVLAATLPQTEAT